jgi:predicted unusual protein kinase regulating ubiquinone biosynthesis (AarF/ABC1/UbiB family)
MGDGDRDDPLREINHRWLGRAIATGKIAKDALRLASRGLMKKSGAEVDAAIGEDLARELDRMKGIAMKVGQILSYFEGTLPPQTHEALRKLQRGAQPVAFESLVPVLGSAFGLPVHALFESIDATPVAAASIGQVHRAVYAGQRVAVKIRYPNVRETFEADFARLDVLARIASLATAVDGAALAAELRERVLEECDYLREADHQEAFTEAFAGDDRIVIPEVIRARAAEAVLTTAWQDGADFYEVCERADSTRRSDLGSILARFAYQSFFQLGALNADPHPGNYLFPSDGKVVFLDFGCVRRFEPDYVERERSLARVVVHDQRADFRRALLETGIVADPKKFDFDAHWALMRHQYAPYSSARFRFTPEYLRVGMDFSKPDNPNLRRLAIAPPWIWQQRLQWGLHAVLVRLGAEGPFREVMLEALERKLSPLRVPARAARTGGDGATPS